MSGRCSGVFHWQPKESVRDMVVHHFILTRFNILLWTKDKKGNKVRTREWLEHRFALFERFCLPSMKSQSCKDFEWIVLFDSYTPEEYRARIGKYVAECPQLRPVYVEPKNGRYFAEIFRSEVLSRLLGRDESDRVLTTYLDNDDALNVRFVEDAQKRATMMPVGSFLYYSDGYQLFTDKMYLMRIRHQRNHFVSVVESANPETLKTIYGYGSHYFIDRIPGVKIERVMDLPMWCEVVHEKNMGNDAYSLKARRVKDARELLSEDFGLHEDVTSGLGLYLFDFVPRFVKRVAKEIRSRIRGYQFE